MFNLQSATQLLALLLSGLIAGLFYSYSCSVNPGLGRLVDEAYLRAMQSINTAIQKPLFFLSFMGALIILPIVAWMNYAQTGFSFSTGCLIAASLLYAIGVFGVTIAGNVPLNNILAAFNIDSASPASLHGLRQKFEGPWNGLHSIRTICAVLTFLLAALPLVRK